MRHRGLIGAGGMAALLATAVWLLAAAPALGADTTVAIARYSFTPASVTIDQGDTVMWRWVGPDTLHDVISDPGQPDPFESSPPGNPGPPPFNVFGHTFTQPGTFTYSCSIHSLMRGTVVVQPVVQPGGGAADAGTPGVPAGQLGAPAVCVSVRNFRIRIRAPRGASIIGASVTVNGKPVDVRAEPQRYGYRFTAPVDLRGLPKGTYEVQIKARAADGRILRGSRRYRTCAPKLASTALPPL